MCSNSGSSSGLGPLTENRKPEIENRKYESPNPDSKADSDSSFGLGLGLGLGLVIGFGPYLRPGFLT